MDQPTPRPTGTTLRVVAWNCYGNVDRKFSRVIDAFAPDVVIVPESEPNPAAAQQSLLAPAAPHAWIGDRGEPSKGLGLFAPSASSLTVLRTSEEQPAGEWIVADVSGPQSTRVIGAVMRPHPGGGRGWPTPYIATTADMLDHVADLIVETPTIVGGDFNFSAQSSGQRVRSIFDHFRDAHGLRSAYHVFFDVEPGDESHMTLSWRWDQTSQFHCDLVFVPDSYEVLGVHVGAYDAWTGDGATTRSDHVPVVVDLRAI